MPASLCFNNTYTAPRYITHTMAPSSAARPKRAGEDFARTHEDTTKKPRFDYRNPSTLAADAPEEDVILDADVIGKSGNQTKRNAVNIDGYDSDSSTENFDARAEAKNKKVAAPEDDDDDMFAEDDKNNEQDEDTRRDQTKKKELRFLDVDEIEGQEAGSKAGGHVAVDFTGKGKDTEDVESSSESGDDDDRDAMDPDIDEEIGAGGKKKHAPKLDAFNMSAEQEEGRFDEAGNFVRKAYDPEAAQDSWLEGISKKDIKRAKEAQDMRDAELKARERAEDAIITSDVLSTLIARLDVGETPLEALVRYGKAAPKKQKPTYSKKKKSAAMEVDEDPAQAAAAAIEALRHVDGRIIVVVVIPLLAELIVLRLLL